MARRPCRKSKKVFLLHLYGYPFPGINGLHSPKSKNKDFPDINIAIIQDYDLPENTGKQRSIWSDRFMSRIR